MINPYWIEDPDVKKGEVDFLTTAEIQFWKDLIDTYLRPIDEDKEEQVSSFNGYLYETYRSALENFLAPSASAISFVIVPRSNVLQNIIFKLINPTGAYQTGPKGPPRQDGVRVCDAQRTVRARHLLAAAQPRPAALPVAVWTADRHFLRQRFKYCKL